MKKIFVWLLFLWTARTAVAQQQLDTVVLNASPYTLAAADSLFLTSLRPDTIEGPPASLAGWLASTPSADWRGPGPWASFGDLSISGGHFNQNAVLINGIPLFYSQTGHHLLQLPLDGSAIEQLNVYNGFAAYGGLMNALAGALDFRTLPRTPLWQVNAEAGQYHLRRAALHVGDARSHARWKWSSFYAASDGYLTQAEVNNTDAERYGQWFAYQWRDGRADWLVQSGWLHNAFGVNRLYSVYFPWEYESIAQFHAGGRYTYRFSPQWQGGILVSYNRLRDRFELFREDVFMPTGDYYVQVQTGDTAQYAPGVYYTGANVHLTRDGWLQAFTAYSYRQRQVKHTWSGGVALHYRQIWSNRLGQPLERPVYLHNSQAVLAYGDRQSTWQAYVNYARTFPGGYAAFWLNGLMYEGRFIPLGGLRAGWRLPYKWLNEIGLTAGQAYRLPTFTERYYRGPVHQGDPGLAPEQNLEIRLAAGGRAGARTTWKTHLFYRYGLNNIDWVMMPGDSIWRSVNLPLRQTAGWQVQAGYHPHHAWLYRLDAGYQFITANALQPQIDTKYADDYLRHHLTVSLLQRPLSRWTLRWQWIYKQRHGMHPVWQEGQWILRPYRPYAMLHLDLTWHANARQTWKLHVYNLTGTQAWDLSNVPLPGRWISLSWQWRMVPSKK